MALRTSGLNADSGVIPGAGVLPPSAERRYQLPTGTKRRLARVAHFQLPAKPGRVTARLEQPHVEAVEGMRFFPRCSQAYGGRWRRNATC